MAGTGAAVSVLVTGGAGYIGSHAVNRLLEAGEKVVVYDNLSTGLKKSIARDVQFIFGDIRDHDLISRVMKDSKIEAVLHFAAKSVVPESVEKPLDYYENNVIGTLQILKACLKNEVKKFIFSSSASVYGDPQVVPLLENSPTAPTNPYGHTKLMGEKLIEDMHRAHGLNFVILRYFNVAGAKKDLSNGQLTENASHLVKVASEAACGQRAYVDVYGDNYPTPDGTGLRDYIDIEDLVEAHWSALTYLRNNGTSQILNCGYGHGFSVLQVLDMMKKVSGTNFEIRKKDRRAGDVAQSFAETSKIRKTLNWKPQFDDLETICRSAFRWEQKHRASK
jgi:UDP-glucose 4-epimerase